MSTQAESPGAVRRGVPSVGAGGGASRDAWMWKVCAWSGPAFLALLGITFVVIAGFVPPPREHWTALQVAHFYSTHDARIKVGMEGMLLVAALYYFWSIAVARVMSRTERSDSPLCRIQLGGGLSTAWVTAGAGMAFLVAAFRAGHRDPNIVQLMNDIGWLIFNLTAMFTMIQMFAMGTAWLRADPKRALVPRWVAYLCFCDALTFLLVFAIPFVQSGPLAWHGFITFYVLLVLFGIWMSVASWAVIRAQRVLDQDSSAVAFDSRQELPGV